MDGVIRDETLIEKDIQRFLSIVFALERTNQLSLLPDKDLVDLCHPIEPYQVTKNHISINLFYYSFAGCVSDQDWLDISRSFARKGFWDFFG
ncbi:MAG UNVERIFIED_CONTAM: hypothetical protein LVR29_06855 [Microcystis novacekii LVE1205-3]|jgi:hypothetical protein